MTAFETSIQYSRHADSWTDKYLLQHCMFRTCGDDELDAWAKDLKLLPWVAIAAPLIVRQIHARREIGSRMTNVQ